MTVANRPSSHVGTKVLTTIENISKSYASGRNKTAVLRDVSFEARPGHITIVTGPSGSGKTTLLRIIGGLSRPDGGSVKVGDRSLYAMRDRALSKYRNHTIGFVFQDYRLLEQYNAIENVMVPLIIAGMNRRERKQRAQEVLEIVGLGKFARQRVSQLSGGQKQRVSIARALAFRPSLLIADEPTGNLDTARGTEIVNMFIALKERHGIGIIMVTHDDHLAAQADHLIRIVDGVVVEDRYAS